MDNIFKVFYWIRLEKETATHSSIHAWKIPWTEEPGGLQSMGLQRVGHDWATSVCVCVCVCVCVYWIRYNTVFCFGFLALRHVGLLRPQQGLNLRLPHWRQSLNHFAPGMSPGQILRTHAVLAVTSILIKSWRADMITPLCKWENYSTETLLLSYGHTAGRWEVAEPG